MLRPLCLSLKALSKPDQSSETKEPSKLTTLLTPSPFDPQRKDSWFSSLWDYTHCHTKVWQKVCKVGFGFKLAEGSTVVVTVYQGRLASRTSPFDYGSSYPCATHLYSSYSPHLYPQTGRRARRKALAAPSLKNWQGLNTNADWPIRMLFPAVKPWCLHAVK